MDFNTAAILIQSEDAQKQLNALKALLPLIERNSIPTDNVISAIIERGLTSEKDKQIRKLSFDCIHKLYNFRIRNWNDVRAAIVTELGTADSSLALLAAVDVLHVIPKYLLINFVGSKEGMSAIRSCCFSNDSEIRAIAVRKLGVILINIWQLIDNSRDIDGFINAESISEARRFREDIRDFIKDFFKDIAYGAIGKPKGVDQGLQFEDIKIVNASFCYVLNCLFRSFNESHNVIKKWMFNLLGLLAFPNNENTETEITDNSVCLIPLLKSVLPTLCSNLYVFISRCQQTSYAIEITSAISILVISLLHESIPGSSHSICLELGPMLSNQFVTDTNDSMDILASVTIPLPVNIVQLATEWVTVSLMQAIRSHNMLEVLQIARDSLLMVHDERLSISRHKVCTIVLDNLIRILPTNIITTQQPQKQPQPLTSSILEIISLALLAARNVSKESTLIASLSRVSLSLDIILVDDMIRTRLLTELVMTLLSDSTRGGACVHPDILKAFLDDHSVASALSEASSAQRTFRVRISAALLRGICRFIPLVLRKMLTSFPSSKVRRVSALLQCDTWFATSISSWDMLPPFKAIDPEFESSGQYLGNTVGLSKLSNVLQFQYVLTNAMTLVKSLSRCLFWSVSGIAGDSTAQCYLQLLQMLFSLLLATDNNHDDDGDDSAVEKGIETEKPENVNDLHCMPEVVSLKKAFKEFLLDDIVKTKLSLKYPSSTVKSRLIKLVGVYLRPLCSSDEGSIKAVGGLLLDEIKNGLTSMSRRETYFQTLKHDAWFGMLGGSQTELPPHSYAYLSTQWDSLDALEKMVLHNPILSVMALEILHEFRNICKYEISKTAKDLSPLLLEKAELVTRRIIELSPHGNSILSYVTKSLAKSDHANLQAASNATNKLSVRINHLDLLDIGGPVEDNVMSALLRPASGEPISATFLANICQLETFDDVLDREINDPGLEFGMWSEEATSLILEPLESVTFNGKQVCTADVVGLIDDVISSHLASPYYNHRNSNGGNCCTRMSDDSGHSLSSSPSLIGQSCLHNMLGSLSSDPMLWKTVNGGGDLFTVQCCLDYQPTNYSVVAKVRIINSGGFKVPFFTLQTLAHSNHVYDTDDGSVSPAVSPFCNAVTEYDGAEYFLCNSSIETHFPLQVHRFDSAAIVVRITFPNLAVDNPTDSFFIKSDNSVIKSKGVSERIASGLLGNLELSEFPSPNIITSSNNNSHTASASVMAMVIDSQPLSLSLIQYLIPYGMGSLSSLSRFSGHISRFTPGIPKPIFTSLWNRCVEGGNVSIVSVLPSRATGSGLSELVTEAVTLYDGKGCSSYTKVIGMSSRVDLTRSKEDDDNDNSKSMKRPSNHYIATLAWALQTWWGDEVGVLITAYRGSYSIHPNPYVTDTSKRSVVWSGRLEIRASCKSVAIRLMSDIDAFIYALTGGTIEICRNNFGYNILQNDVGKLSAKTSATGSIPPILGSVQNAPSIIH